MIFKLQLEVDLIMARALLAGLNLQICYDIDNAGIGLMPAPCGCGRLNVMQ